MKTDFLKKLLYIPNYLSLPVAGIEICNKSIKYIEFLDYKGNTSIKKFGEIVLAPDVIKDGDILNRNALVKALVEVKKNISSDFVKLSIPEEKTYIFDVQIPKEAKGNIREALEFRIEENVPLKLEESCFEYEVVDEDFSSKDMMVNVSVVSKRIIADYSEVVDQAGLYPVSYEIESKMIANSVVEKGDKRSAIILNIKDDSTTLVAVIDDFVRLSSSISIGENVIVDTLFKTGLFKNKAEIGKFFENDFSFETIYTKESYLSLVNIFSIYKDEVEKFNEYILNKFPVVKSSPSGNVDRIVLCGRSSSLPGLTKHINQNIKTEIVLANTVSNVCDVKECTSNIKFQDSLNFVTPIGLVIASYRQANA